jgi:glutamine cyclotransferase
VTGGPDEPAIIALDLHTGQQLWQYPLGHNTSRWQVVGSQIYVQTSPSHDALTSVCFVVSGSTGKLLWRFPSAGEAVIFSLLVGAGQVYVEHSSGQPAAALISAFDATSGALKWQQPLADGIELVGTGNGSVYALTLTELVALSTADGKEQWHSVAGEGATGTAGSAITVVPGAVYITVTGVGLVKLNSSDGAQAWHVPLEDPSGITIAAVNQGALYAGQLIEHQILALDTATGKVLWRYDVSGLIAYVTLG